MALSILFILPKHYFSKFLFPESTISRGFTFGRSRTEKATFGISLFLAAMHWSLPQKRYPQVGISVFSLSVYIKTAKKTD